MINSKSGRRQTANDRVRDELIVFDQQYAHRRLRAEPNQRLPFTRVADVGRGEAATALAAASGSRYDA
jgi:hypothetical protein